MSTDPTVRFDRTPHSRPIVSIVIGDWSGAPGVTAVLEALDHQDIPREQFEVVWVDWTIDTSAAERWLEERRANGRDPVIDRWVVLERSRAEPCLPAVLANVGIVASRGEIVTLLDVPALVTPSFVRSIADHFLGEPSSVLHLDAVVASTVESSVKQSPEHVLRHATNWARFRTVGTANADDAWRVRDYSACLSALRNDLVLVGGVEQHRAMYGRGVSHELTWRLGQAGRREVWHRREFVFRTGQRGEAYGVPSVHREVSPLAQDIRRTRRTQPLVRNGAFISLRSFEIGPALAEVLREEPRQAWWNSVCSTAFIDGRIAAAEGRHLEAFACWSPLREPLTADPFLSLDFGWLALRAGHLDEARAAFERAVEQGPGSATARHGLGATHRAQALYSEAVESLTMALDEPDGLATHARTSALIDRGWARLHLNDVDGAGHDFEQSLPQIEGLDPVAIQLLYRGLGWTSVRRSDRQAARDWFTRALEMVDPADTEAAKDVQTGLERTTIDESPVADLPTAVPSRPEEPKSKPPEPKAEEPATQEPAPFSYASTLRDDLGWAFQAAGNYAPAVNAFREALALSNDNLSAWCGLGWASLRLGRDEQAQRAFNIVLKRRSTAPSRVVLDAFRGRGWLAYRQGRYRDAIDDFTRGLRLADKKRDRAVIADMRRGRSRAYYASGQRAAAVSEYALATRRAEASAAIVLRAAMVKAHLRGLFRRFAS